jgi:hypothetical protein
MSTAFCVYMRKVVLNLMKEKSCGKSFANAWCALVLKH